MNAQEITLTSKNQITIPAKIAKSIGLSKGSILHITSKGNQIILTKDQGLSSLMPKYWRQTKVVLSDQEIKLAVRQSAVRRAK